MQVDKSGQLGFLQTRLSNSIYCSFYLGFAGRKKPLQNYLYDLELATYVNYSLICRNPKVNSIEPKAEAWDHCFRSLTSFNQFMFLYICIGVGGVTSTNFAIYKNTFRRRYYQNAFSNLPRRFLNDIWKKNRMAIIVKDLIVI